VERDVSADPVGDAALDLGGCEGCALSCAVTCSTGDDDRVREARRVLIGSGVALLLLSVGPALVARQPLVAALGLLTAALGAVVAALAGVAVRAGRPRGDRVARLAFRLLPVGLVGMCSTWVGTALARVL
jgi:hypothetical protein